MNKTTLNSQKEKHSMLFLRRATVQYLVRCLGTRISIHALLAESDAVVAVFCHDLALISIHALLAESDSKSAQNSGALLRI